MHKLMALIPLLGWFYITIFAFVVITWLLRGRLAWVQKLYYLAFGALALVFAGQSLLDEVKLYPISKITLMDSYEQKIDNEVGSFYKTYYVEARPATNPKDKIYIDNIDIREYYYARMFLYPAEVSNTQIPPTQALTIADNSTIERFTRKYKVLEYGKTKSLVEVDAVATSSAKSKGSK